MGIDPREQKIEIESVTVPIREFGNSTIYSKLMINGQADIEEIAKKMLVAGRFSPPNMLAYLPDAVIVTPLRFTTDDFDILHRSNRIAYRIRFASRLYEYWTEYAKSEARTSANKVRQDLKSQYNKNWWTKLCWKLGSFIIKEDINNDN